MGYCMDQRDSRFRVRKENLPHVLGALKALAMRAPAQSWGHFSWVDTATIQRASSVQEHLKEWRWQPKFDESGDLASLSFNGEKLGSDKDLFDAMAPFVERGSFIQMQGEDGEMWRWYFDGRQCLEQTPTVSFASDDEDIIDIEARDVTPQTQPGRLLGQR